LSGPAKISAGIWIFGKVSDRFCTAGYREDLPFKERVRRAASIPGLKGIELQFPLGEITPEEAISVVTRHGLEIVAVGPDLAGQPKWMFGALASPDPKIRREAVELCKDAMDFAHKVNALVNIWPGQDGYDYPFQVDYVRAWDTFVESLKEIAEYKPDVKVSLEYKMTEPRIRLFAGTVGKSLLAVEEAGADNLGITIDIGHSLLAYEGLAEAAVLAAKRNKLFHLHMNDCFRRSDDDLIVGAVHLVEYLELFYWLNKTGYEGWFSFDQFPYREDPVHAVSESVKNLRFMFSVLERLDEESLQEVFKTGDATKAVAVIRKALGGES